MDTEFPGWAVLPLPGADFYGDTVIASVWLNDDEAPFTALVMLLRPQPAYYQVCELQWNDELVGSPARPLGWMKTSSETYPNINPATEAYATNGGDY